MARHQPRVVIHVGPSELAEVSTHRPRDGLASRETNYFLKKITFVVSLQEKKNQYTNNVKIYMGKKPRGDKKLP